MSFEIKGKLHKIFETEQKTDTFQTREFVIETQDGNYTQYVKFQLTQERCQMADTFSEGQEINVHFDLRGREWQGKYFTNLNAWRLEPVSGQEPVSAEMPDGFPEEPQEPEAGMDDDLPF